MKITKLLRQPRVWLLALLASLAIAEASVRALGMVDFALYQADAQIGYIPAANQQGTKTTFVLYPDKPEAADAALAAQHFAAGQALLTQAGATRVLQVQQDKRWGVGQYKDGIHPTAAGFGVLAGIIGDDLARLERVGGL